MSLTPEQVVVVTDVLQRTRKLLVEKGWTKYTSARDSEDRPISYMFEGACSFCLTGAIARTTRDLHIFGTYNALAYQALHAVAGQHPPTFNDTQETVEPVLALIDQTIKCVAVAGAVTEYFEGYQKP